MWKAATAMLAVLSLCLFATTVDAKSASLVKVKGELSAADDDSEANGKFMLLTGELSDRKRERLGVYARGLDADTEYEVLLGADGDDVSDGVSFGEMKVRKRGKAWMIWKSKRNEYPDDVETLSDFGGGTIWVVAGETVVLSADIPGFPGLDDDEVDEGASAVGLGWERLEAPENSRSWARGSVAIAAANTSDGLRERITVLAMFLKRNEEYEVVAIDDDDGETEIGTMVGRSRMGLAYLVLDTGRDDTLPASLATLAGQTLEVRNEDGDVVLTCVFPELS